MAFILNEVTQAIYYNRNVTLLQSNSLFDNEERDGDLTISLVAQCFADFFIFRAYLSHQKDLWSSPSVSTFFPISLLDF